MNGTRHDLARALLRHVSLSGSAEGFELPLPPRGLVYPQTAQVVATTLAGSALAVAVLYALGE